MKRRIRGNSVKPMGMGPISGSQNNGTYTLTIPLALQGEWRNTDDGLDMLEERAGDIEDAINQHLIESGRYVPQTECHTDSPARLDASGGSQNRIAVLVTCKDGDEAKVLVDLIKGNAELMEDVEVKMPGVMRRRTDRDDQRGIG